METFWRWSMETHNLHGSAPLLTQRPLAASDPAEPGLSGPKAPVDAKCSKMLRLAGIGIGAINELARTSSRCDEGKPRPLRELVEAKDAPSLLLSSGEVSAENRAVLVPSRTSPTGA